MAKYIKNQIYLFALMVSLVFAVGCMRANEERRDVTSSSDKPEERVSDVDKVFKLAKDFASGAKTGAVVKAAFDKLSKNDQRELFNKQEGAASFAVLMVVGLASDDSVVVVEKAINASSNVTKDQLFGNELMRELLSKSRPKGEDQSKRLLLIEIVLTRYPKLINELKKTDRSFDIELFNDLVLSLSTAKLTPIAEKVSLANLDAMVSWALANPPVGKPAFQQLYDKVLSMQLVLRKLLLTKVAYDPVVASRHALITALIDEANDWGIGGPTLATDAYELPSINRGTTYMGTFLDVLLYYAIEKDSQKGAVARTAFQEFRIYAEKIKNLIGGNPTFVNYVAPPPVAGVITMRDRLQAHLAATNHEDWANFFFTIEQVNDVLNAAEKTAVSNDMLQELYGLVITGNAQALALSNLPAKPAGKFLHLIAARSIDARIVAMADDFLVKASVGIVAQEAPILLDNAGTGGKNALQLVAATVGRPITDDVLQKKRLIERLVLNDTGAAALQLTNSELTALVTDAYAQRGAGGRGQADFKALYTKMNNYVPPNAKVKFVRSELLRLAQADGPGAVQNLVMDIMAAPDPWGLNGGAQTDEYKLGAANGTLLYVLTQHAIATMGGNGNALRELRGYARVYKASLGQVPYTAHVQNMIATNGADAIRKVLANALLPAHRDNFTNYYLAIDSPQDVFDAAARPEAQVSNQMLRELYDLVIADVHQLAHDLSQMPGGGNVDRFVHSLMARSTDINGDLCYVVNKFLGSLSTLAGGGLAGATAELNALNAQNSGGLLPFKILTVRGGAIADDPGKKLQIIKRMMVACDNRCVGGMAPNQLSALVPVIVNDPATFKKIYGFFGSTSAEAIALRSALLASYYAKGPAATKRFLNEAIGDKWGIRTSITDAAQEYELDKNPVIAPPHSGPILYVLTMRAIDDSAGNTKSYRELREYAAIVKGHFNFLGVNFDAYTTVTPFGPRPQATMKDRLGNALAPSGRRFFANSFLARESHLDVYDAADEPQATVSNAMLKTLYLSVIGHDPVMVTALADHNGAPTTDKFIHRLVKRTVDEEGYQILKFFLDDLGGAARERDQLNDTGASNYPIKLLANQARVAGDHPVFKVKMFDRLLAHDDGTALMAIDAADFKAQRCFVAAGVEGQQLFAQLYKSLHVVSDPAKLRALRSGVLNEAFELNKQKEVITQFTDLSNPWTLRPNLAGDEFDLEQNPPVPFAFHQGKLLHVVTERAIQTANINLKYSYDAYKDLREISMKLRSALNNNPGDYVTYARLDNPDDAVTKLKNELDPKPNHHGLAEYYLDLDNTLPNFDEALVMRAVSNLAKAGVFDNAQLQWIYQKAIDTDNKAQVLSTKLDSSNNSFLHLLLAKTLSSPLNLVLSDYLTKVTNASGLGRVNVIIAQVNSGGRNTLQIIADKKRKDSGAERNKAVTAIAINAAQPTFQTLNTDEVKIVLMAIHDVGNALGLKYAFSNLADAQMGVAASWSAEQKATITPGKAAGGTTLKDNIEDDNVRDTFSTEYARRSAPVQKAMHNNLVKTAFEVGDGVTPKKGALERVARLVERDFFSDPVLKAADFNPFGIAGDGNLLYTVLVQADPMNQSQVGAIIAAFRAKFTNLVDWQNYLDSVANPGGQSILVYMTTKAGSVANARVWLSYNT